MTRPTPQPSAEIVVKVKEEEEKGSWYSVRVGFSESRVRTDALRDVMARQGFTQARTEKGTDGLYCVLVSEHDFRHHAEETFNKLKEMGFEPEMHERTVAK